MDPEKTYRENIYKFCAGNEGEIILPTALTILWPLPDKDDLYNKEYSKTNSDLVELTTKIMVELASEKILKRVRKSKDLEFSPYPMYKILTDDERNC